MYKVWSIEDIKLIINEISEKWNYPCDIKIEVSKRATKRMGAFFYRIINNKIEPIKFVFAESLLNGSYSEDIVSIIEKFYIGSGYTVARNTPYSNSLTPCKPINYKSVMIELNKRIYINEDTITPNENYTKLKEQINELYKKLLELQCLTE